MFNALAVTLRELAELLLIAEAMQLCFRQKGRPDLFKGAVAGMVTGAAAGVLLSAWLARRPADDSLAAAITIVFSLAVVLLATGMLSSAYAIRNRVEDLFESWIGSPSGRWLAAAFALIVGMRESLEIGLFLDAIRQDVGAEDMAAGAASGALAATCLALVYRTIKARIQLLALYGVSTLLMSLLSIQLLIAGLGELLRAQLHADSSWLSVFEPFLQGGRGYPWLCATLMTVPLVLLASRWWREAAVSRH